jgi:8-oxo-dGTP diphosphatase
VKKEIKAAGVLFTDGESVLILKRAGEGKNVGTWGLPGGKAKNSETEIETAHRETREETGLDTIPGQKFDSISNDGDAKNAMFTAFFYRVPEPFDIEISKEHSDWKWIPISDLKSEKLHPKFRENLARYLTSIRRKITSFSEWSKITTIINELQ